jgi:hypothetical protein
MYDALKSNKGFVTVDDLFNRMRKFRPPSGETYVMKRIPGRDFVLVGVSGLGETFKLFHLYAGNRDLYLYLRDMICEAANKLAADCVVEEWNAEQPGD